MESPSARAADMADDAGLNDSGPIDAGPIDASDPAAVLSALIRCPSVTPAEGGALAVLEGVLKKLGFAVERPVFSEAGTPDVENLFARSGTGGPTLVFAGHTDVVPPGDARDWRHGPFSAAVDGGEMYGRGAVDMKGGIAAFVAACGRLAAKGPLPGSVAFLVTGDEEGPSINGTPKLLDWALERGERFDACLVGEPTNPRDLGDMIKIGRRGSLSGTVEVTGRQGHVAYPHLAANPIPALVEIARGLTATPLDGGTERFPASNLEITSIDTGNPAVNVIPARCRLAFNIRFCDLWTPDSLKAEIENRIARARNGTDAAVEIVWRERPAEAFLTRNDRLTQTLVDAVAEITGKTPELSTSGGTSDARYIKNICPVVEFGLVGKTMHMADERVPLADLENLARVYETFLSRWFASLR